MKTRAIDYARLAIQFAVSAAVLLAAGYLEWHVLNMMIPAENRELAVRLAGSLDVISTGVVWYWIGSTVSSARKDDPKPSEQTA